MSRKNWKVNIGQIIATILVVAICFTCVGNVAWAAEDVELESSTESIESSTEGVETVKLVGKILSMGYEFNCPKTTLKDTIKVSAVCKEDNTVVQMTTSEGEYSLELKKDKVYTVTYSGYISGRMARMTIPVSILTTEDKDLNLIIRTNNVLGLSTENEYLEQYPTNSIVIRNLNSGRWFDESLSIEPANVELSVKGEQQLQVKTSSGLVYENGYEYQSSDPSIATVDENGVVTGVSKGSVVITCTLKGEDGIKTESNVLVSNGFDYTKDGFCFANSSNCFSYDGEDYYIPFERYEEVFGDNITKNYYNLHLKKRWGGNCFGMSMVALLFYYDYLDREKYAPKCYEEGETINQGFYDKFLTDEDGSNVVPVIMQNSELTKLIERYQVWQDGTEAKKLYKKSRVGIDEIIENWNSGKSYMAYISWWESNEDGKGELVGHRVVLDMHGEPPVKNSNNEYEFLIYDPNFPAFTDEKAEFECSSPKTYLKVSKEGFEVKTASNASQQATVYLGERSDIDFLELDSENSLIPADFNGNAKYLSFLEKKMYSGNAEDLKIWASLGGVNSLILEIEDSKTVYQDEGIEIEYDSNGSNTKENSFSFEYDSDDLIIEMPTGGKFFALTSNSIDGVVVDGKVKIRTSCEGIGVETEEESKVSVLAESHHEDGTITSILAEGESATGNVFTCALDENDQYTLKSTKEMEANLTLNTEDSNVVKEKTIVAKDDSEEINVVEYIAGETATPTPSISATEVPTVTPTTNATEVPTVTTSATETLTITPKANVTQITGNQQKKTQTISAKNITKTYGNKAFNIGAKTDGDGKLTFTSRNKKVAVVSKGGKVTIKGCGKTTLTIKASETNTYKASEKKITLTVKPKKQKVSSAKSTKAKTITVKWKKDTKATGYILQYSTDKKFKKNVKKITIANNKTTSKRISRLKAGKKYYVRVCSYKKSSGKKIQGSYSAVKSVKVKK